MSSPLDLAYALVNKADHALLHLECEKASKHYLQAADHFTEAIRLTSSHEAQLTLKAMADQYRGKGNQLKDTRVVAAIQKQHANSGFSSGLMPNSNNTFPSSVASNLGANSIQIISRPKPDELVSSLASARGIPKHRLPQGIATNVVGGTGNAAAAVALSSVNPTVIASSLDEPLYKFYSTVNQAFSKAYNSAVSSANADPTVGASGGGANGASGLESFYIVPSTVHPIMNNATKEELMTEVASLRQLLNKYSNQTHAYEQGLKAQKDTFKTALSQMKKDLTTMELNFQRQYETEIEQLRSENDKLKIQNGRLRSKWDDLKEQARKKRGTSA